MAESKKFAKLIMVAINDVADSRKAMQSNKYYIMEWDGISSNFNVKYGRVESTEATASYPIGKWDSQLNSKLKKGYKDITYTVSVTVETTDRKTELKKIEDDKVEHFLNLMKKYTDNLVSNTYTVRHENVTQKQVDEAQNIINDLNKIDKKDISLLNSKLLELYMVIPRRMGNVRDYLIPNINVTQALQQEQINLDAMASQVKMYKKDDKKKKTEKSLLDLLGINRMTTGTPGKDIEYLIKQLTGQKISSFFELEKPSDTKIFTKWMDSQKNKQTRLLIHGTKCASVIPILEQGLKIRPSGNYQFSGKVYGNGNYFSEVCSKSLGYTGYDKDKVLLVYEVHVGKPFEYEGWYRGNNFTLCYPELQKRGFDSTYVKAGSGLLNSEIIAYNEEQCKIKYIIWLQN